MVLGKRQMTGKTTSAKRAYTGANSYSPYPRLPRKGYYGRRSYWKKGYNQQLKEVKYQTTRHNYNVDYSGFIGAGGGVQATGILLNGTDVGADIKQRIGRRITMKTLQLRVTLKSANQPINEYGSSTCRILVVYDRAPNGVINSPVFADILEPSMQTTTPTGVTHYINAGKNMINKDRFMFLLDKTYSVQQVYGIPSLVPPFPPSDSSHTTTYEVQKNFYINLKNLNVAYNGISSSLNNINEGALFFVAMTNKSGAGNADYVYCEFASRVRFVDM